MADSSLRLVLLMREIPREPQFVSTQPCLSDCLTLDTRFLCVPPSETGRHCPHIIDFKTDHYLEQGVMHWSPGGQVRLELKVKPWLANHLDESPLSYQPLFCVPAHT